MTENALAFICKEKKSCYNRCIHFFIWNISLHSSSSRSCSWVRVAQRSPHQRRALEQKSHHEVQALGILSEWSRHRPQKKVVSPSLSRLSPMRPVRLWLQRKSNPSEMKSLRNNYEKTHSRTHTSWKGCRSWGIWGRWLRSSPPRQVRKRYREDMKISPSERYPSEQDYYISSKASTWNSWSFETTL